MWCFITEFLSSLSDVLAIGLSFRSTWRSKLIVTSAKLQAELQPQFEFQVQLQVQGQVQSSASFGTLWLCVRLKKTICLCHIEWPLKKAISRRTMRNIKFNLNGNFKFKCKYRDQQQVQGQLYQLPNSYLGTERWPLSGAVLPFLDQNFAFNKLQIHSSHFNS